MTTRLLFFVLFCASAVLASAATGTATYTAAGVGYYTVDWTVTANTSAHTVSVTLVFNPRPDGNPWPKYVVYSVDDSGTSFDGYMNSFVDVRTGGTRSVTNVAYNTSATKIALYFTWYGNESVTPVTVLVPLQDSPQTCTISNTGAPAVSGQTITGTASGAQAGNPYNISVVSGPASASINSSTGAYSVTATGAGAISYKVWISAGNGYLRSNDAVGGGTAGASKKVRVTIPANNGNFPIRYTLTQGGVVIGTYLQMPGASAFIAVIDVGANDGPVTVSSSIVGVRKDPNDIYIKDPSTETTTGIIDTVTPTSDPNASAVDVTPPPANSSKDPSAPENKSDNVWSSEGDSSDYLTNGVFREGIDKLMEDSDTFVDDDTYPDMNAPVIPDASVTVAGVQNLVGKLPDKPVLQAPGTSSTMTISLPLMTTLSATQNFNFTWSFTSWVTSLSWLRTFILGCLSVWFYFAINRQLRDSVAN